MVGRNDDVQKLYKKIEELEKKVDKLSQINIRVERLESYCRSLEDALGRMNNEFKQIFESLNGFMKFISGVFK